jgi:hypothetical protein
MTQQGSDQTQGRTIRRFISNSESVMAVVLLEQHGIHAELIDEDGPPEPDGRRICRLVVDAGDEQAAREVIDEIYAAKDAEAALAGIDPMYLNLRPADDEEPEEDAADGAAVPL